MLAVTVTVLHLASASGQGTTEPGYRGSYATLEDSLRLQALVDRVMETYQQYPDTALAYAEKACDLARNAIRGGDHPDLASAVASLGFLYEMMGDRTRARPLYVESLAMHRRMYRGDHFNLAQSLNNMAYLHHESAEYAEAETLFVAAQEMKTRLYRGDHEELALGHNNLAVLYNDRGFFDKAAVHYDSSLAMMRRLNPEGSPSLAQMIGNVGYFLVTQGRLRDGERLYLEALAMYARLLPDDHEGVITMRNNLGYLYERQGRLADAERMYLSAVEAVRRRFPEDHPVKATTISNLGSYYLARGMDAEGEQLYIEALDIRKRLYPDGHPELLVSINNMGYFHTVRGRFREAEELYRAAEDVLDRIAPGDHPFRALHSNNLGSLYAEQGYYARAESLFTASLEMKLRLAGQPDRDIGLSYNNIGTVLRDQGRRQEAGEMFVRALTLFRTLEEDVSHEIAVTLGNLGRIRVDLGDTEDGIRNLEESKRMKMAMYDDGHIERIAAERNLAQAFAQLGRIEPARERLEDLLSQIAHALRQSFGFDSEAHQLDFMNNVLKPNLDLLSHFCLHNADRDPSLAALLLQALLQFKGAVANETARRSAEWSKDRFAIEVRDKLTRLREQDAQLASRAQDEHLRLERREIQRRADSLDAALRKLDREYDKLRMRQDADWREIQKQLEADDALIEFAAVPRPGRDPRDADTLQYAAVVLRRQGDPVLVPLADERTLLPYFDVPVDPRSVSYVTDQTQSLSLARLVWAPIEALLRGMRRVYLVPDGVLHRLSFHALMIAGDSGDPTFLDDRYELHLLTGARDLLSRNVRYRPQRYRQPENVLLIGDPLFSSADAPTRATRVPSEARTATNATETTAGNEAMRGGDWLPLPGTRKEVELLHSLCRSHDVMVATLMGKDAREERIKEISGVSPRILHIATHGFFFPVPRLPRHWQAPPTRTRSGAAQLRAEDNPMLRSGLVLTGANETWRGGSDAARNDDGILSALEISRLDLYGTELVTLSACETGLGDISNGEGIFGLQRAFQVAGASRILMTLWRVADAPTVEFMQMLYAHLFEGKEVEAALRAARKEMRTRFSSAYYWAGFVLVEQ